MGKKTKEIALGGMMAALGVVFLCLAGILPFALYACPILASAVLLPVREDCRQGIAWCCFAAIALLGLLLCPDKEAAALYCFLGYYPLVKPGIDRIGSRVVRLLAKLGLAAVSMAVMYGLLLWVFQLPAVVDEFSAAAEWLLWLTAVLGAALFLAYDVLLSRFTVVYHRRRKR